MTASVLRVLIVEDNVPSAKMLEAKLANRRFDVDVALDGRKALLKFDEAAFDIVLLDVMLPELDGFETCRRIRGLNGRKLPVVVVTALDNEECRRRGFQVGADAYFTKPFDPDEIVATLLRLIADSNDHKG